MIYKAIEFLRSEMNSYLNLRSGINSNAEIALLDNIAYASDGTGSDAGNLKKNIVLTLVNVEEDTIVKQQENFSRQDGKIVYKHPKIYLNLYVLFTAGGSNYEQSLRRLGRVVCFFQSHPVFDAQNSPALDERVEKLIVTMHSLSFEQLNHLWGILGGKYMPSVLYKVRQVVIDDDAILGEAGYIKEIQINDRIKLPVFK